MYERARGDYCGAVTDTDYYATLGVSRGASDAEIKKAFRALARKLHPDRNPDDKTAEDRFKQVSHAHDVLADAERRKLYDEFGESGLKEGFDPDMARRYGAAGGGFSGAGYGGGMPGGVEFDLGDLLRGKGFEGFFGGQRRARPMEGQELSASVSVSLEEAFTGCTRELSLSRAGEGATSLKVKIPAGIKDGGKVRVRGKGGRGQNGGRDGDLRLRVHVVPHQHFRRNGDHLEIEVPVSVVEAMKGARVSVPTPHGLVTLSVPEKSPSGKRMRLRGKGMPKRGGGFGDLYVVLRVQLPTDPSPELIEAVANLDWGPPPGRDDLAW